MKYIGNMRINNKLVEEFIPDRGFVINPAKTISRYLREHGPVTKSKILKYFQHVMRTDEIDTILEGLEQDGLAKSYRQPTRTKPITVWRAIGESEDLTEKTELTKSG